MPPKDATIRKLQCPCGNVIRFRGHGIVTCPKCGVKLKISAQASELRKATQSTTANPLGSTSNTSKTTNAAGQSSTATQTFRPRVSPTKKLAKSRSIQTNAFIAASALAILIVGSAVIWAILPTDSTSPVATSPLEPQLDDVTNDSSVAAQVAGPPESDQVRIGTYPPGPRLASTKEFIERDRYDRIKALLDIAYREVPPEQNAAPKYLAALSAINASLVNLLDIDEPQKAIRSANASTNSSRIIQWNSAIHIENTAISDRGNELHPRKSELDEFNTLVYQIIAAQQLEGCCFYSIPVVSDEATLRIAAGHFCMLIESRASSAALDHPTDQVILELKAALRLIRDLHQGSANIAMFVPDVEQALLRTIGSVLLTRTLSAEQFRMVFEILEQHDRLCSVNRLRQAIARSAITIEYLLDYAATRDEDNLLRLAQEIFMPITTSGRPNVNSNLSPPQQLIINNLLIMDQNSARAAFDECVILCQKIIAVIDGFGDDALAARKPVLSLIPIQEINTSFRADQPPSLLSQLPAMQSHEYLHDLAMTIAVRRIVYASLALALWQQQNRQSITDISQFVPTESMRIDPCSGQPLKVATVQGKSIVYSIGPDLQDQQGKYKLIHGDGRGDIVLDVP